MKRKLMTLLATAVITAAYAQQQDEKVAYLFTYFTGNAPEEEQICYALSDDGYNYTPLNGGNPVISSDTIAFTQCVRDPHILRCEDGKTFYGNDVAFSTTAKGVKIDKNGYGEDSNWTR